MKETGLTVEGCNEGGGLNMYAGKIVSNLATRCVNTPLPHPVYPCGYPLRKVTGPIYQRPFQSYLGNSLYQYPPIHYYEPSACSFVLVATAVPSFEPL